MKTKFTISILVLLLCSYYISLAQYCGIKDPSIERFSTCPTSHSQLYLKSYHWFNVLNPSISTADYFHEGNSCNFGGFIAAGGIKISYCSTCFRNACSNKYYQGCGRAGIFLNYNDGSQDPKYKEYIGTRVDLIRGRNYNLSIDIQRSNDPSSNTLERDLAIYGYNGALPAAQVGFCPSGAIALDTISRSLLNTDSNVTLYTNFICPANFDYLLIGPVCDGIDATRIGYVYLDKILLSDTRDSTMTPWIKFAGKDSRACCFSGFRSDFELQGNKAPSGTSVLWSQKTTNPTTLSFITPNDSSTRITGTGYLTPGTYDFYYSWNKFGCAMTDTITINVLNNPRANAGADIVVCNGSALVMNASAPTLAEINSRNYLSWWSIIDPASSTGNYSFPLTDPTRQACTQGPEPMHVSLNYVPNATNSPTANFTSLHQADTFKFIWNIVDDCNTYSSDTVTTYNYQFLLAYDSVNICPGDTSGYILESTDSTYNSIHVNRTPLYYTWTILNDSGAAHLVGNIHGDRIRLTSNYSGYFTILVDVYDSTNRLCNHYTSRVTVYIRDTLKVLHPRDIVICGEEQITIVQGFVPPGTEWWWDVVDYTQPDSLFTLFNPDYPSLPNDGIMTSMVKYPNKLDSASAIPNDYYSLFVFPYLGPHDTFTLIYNIRNSCYPYNILKDTVNIITNHLLISGGPPMTCPGDTSIFLFETNFPITANDRSDTSLHYQWYYVSGLSTMWFDSMSTRDSVICNVYNIPGAYTAGLRVYDSDDSTCPYLTSTFSFNVLSPVIMDSMTAGPDIRVCNSQLTPYSLVMNARPTIATLNALGYETWWSLVDYAQPDTEYIFNNGCEPADGFDNGNITCGFDMICGSVNPFSSDAPNCFFIIDNWGCYDFIWHLRYKCNGIEFYKADTVQFCWDFLEPTANAGFNDTATCNVFQLVGNTSAASAANNGCFLWRQINSTTGVVVQIADSSNNIAYLVGLDSIPAGTYYFEYTVGCGTCSKRDTVAIYIPGSLPGPSIHLSSNATDIYLCKGDSVTISASGADQYQFFVNGISVNTLSASNTYTNSHWAIDTNYITVIAYDAVLNCFSTADTALLFIFNSLDSLHIYDDSILFCAGSQTFLTGTTPYSSQRIYWFSQTDNYHTPINLPNGSASGDSVRVAPVLPTYYKATLYDTASLCWSYDTITVKVIPLVVALPNPSVANDTSICAYDDSVLVDLKVFNQLYPGNWTITSSQVIYFTDHSIPNQSVYLPIGVHSFVWTESNLGCTDNDSMTIHILSYPNIDAGNDTTLCKGKQIILQGIGNASNYRWFPSDSVINATELHSLTHKIYSDYILILEGTDDICKSTDTVSLKVINCPSDVKAPSAFSPNGDGNNDFFTVYTYQMKSYEIWIYNRWGENVYYSNNLDETNDLNKGWNGTYKGSIQEAGVYVYYIKALNSEDETIELKGNITLVK